MSQTTFTYPVEKLCGKVSRHSRIIHSCTASGKQITYLQGTRDLTTHPVTDAERARQDLFRKRQKAASARLKHSASTYQKDLVAFHNQLTSPNPITSFTAYIWSLVSAEITA